MNFDRIEIGEVMGIKIHHGVVSLRFEDYDAFFLKIRGRKPVRADVYTASQERGRDYMLGFDFHWGDGKVERLSFKDFWHMFDRGWDWGEKSENLGGHYYNGEYEEPYKVLSLKYTEVVFQTHSNGACAFDRVHDRITGFTADEQEMRNSVKAFDKYFRETIRY